MKNLKKVTAVAVVLLLVLGTMSIGAFASVDSGAVGITINVDKTTNLYPGDIVTFTVNISTNFHYTGMRWPVMYTLKAFEPVVANDGNGDADYGNVDAIDTGKNMVRVIVSMFGRETPVELELDQVEPLE